METLGKPIEPQEANDKMDQHVTLSEVTHGFVQKFVADTKKKDLDLLEAARPKEMSFVNLHEKAQNFFNDDFNVFIFSREEVMRFFTEGSDSERHPAKPADYLMVLLGAHTSDDASVGFKKGEPTIIIAGANNTDGKQRDFQTLKIRFAASEHPPRRRYRRPFAFNKDMGTISVKLID